MRRFSILLGLAALILAGMAPLANAGTNAWLEVSKEGAGHPVLLIPGLASSTDVWSDTAAQISKNYTVYRVQIKGFAGTPAAPGMNEDGLLDGLTEALAAYIKDNDLDQPAIIGHSMGGYLALRLERDHPALISKVLIVDALPFYSAIVMPGANAENMKPIAENYKAQVIAGAKMDPALRRPQQRQMISRLIIDEEGLTKVTDWGMDSDAEVVGQAIFELMTSDLRRELLEVKTPTLVLTAWEPGGRFNEAQTLGFWKGQYSGHGAATVELMGPARHFIMLDQPERFIARVDRFLSEK